MTWEFGDLPPSHVELELADAGDEATELILRHTVPDDQQWAEYGPGAVGVGWDFPLAALAVLLAGGNPPSGEEFMADPRIPGLLRRCAAAWGAAHHAGGASPEVARKAAAFTGAVYAPDDLEPAVSVLGGIP